MGVTGLWKLIEPCGKPVPLETLENKVLAIDISIWLHQVIKGFQDSKGYAVANAHLLGLFHRLCKLLYYRIKPVFVFDGKVPILKKNTIAKRNSKRNKLINEAERIQALLLQSLAKEKVVQKALGTSAAAELLKISPLKSRAADKDSSIDDIFKLPGVSPLEEDTLESDFNTSSETTDTETSLSESKARHYYNQNLQAIDVKSKHFRNLPADIRHEILIDIKETRKQSSWGKLHELPSKSNDFSLFQMKRLLKRRQVQESLEEAEKEMDSTRSFTLNELENIFSEERIIEPSALPNSRHISSDANTRFLLVRDLKKTLATAEAGNKEPEIKPEISKSALAKTNANENCEENMDEEYDNDIQKAILMSLDQSAVYDESDYAYGTEFKFNKEQRRHLKNTTQGLARAYMIEHCGMNNDDVRELLEQSQSFNDYINFSHCINNENNKEAEKINDLNNTNISKATTSTSTSGKGKADLFELNTSAEMSNEEISSNTSTTSVVNESVKHSNTSIEIIVDPSKISSEKDDIFSDILFDTAEIKHPAYDKGNCDVFDKQIQEFEGIGFISSTDTESETEAVIDVVCKDPNIEDLNADNSEIKGTFENNDKGNVLPLNTDNKTNVNAISPHTESKTNDKTITMAEILNDLKKQASEVTKISLNEIKIESAKLIVDDDKNEQDEVESIIKLRPKILQNDKDIAIKVEDILKKDEQLENHEPAEIIEIIDDATTDNNLLVLNTPSKTRVISQFFKTDYVIKRTPEKTLEIPEHVPSARLPKKMLFEKSNNERPEMHEVLEEESVLDVAAKTLKETKTHQELEDMASELAKEAIDLEKQRNRQERMGMTLSEKINSECMQLLRLFGVPFIVAPMEAEAQCAFLNSIKLTNGTITDDSDIWLFGGKTVYKNFFAQNKYVMEFTSENIENHYKVDRQKLIQLALLVGSDYTSGVNGIGPVTALEIIANFSKTKEENKTSNQQPETVLETLEKFRTWWTGAKTNYVAESSMRRRLRNKLKNIELVEGFPCPTVVEAYMAPTVDNNQEAFSWGSPDIEQIEAFTKNNFGWTKLKTDEVLGPVLKKLNEKKSQSTIKNYFSVKSSCSSKHIAVSKRVQSAISKMSIDSKSSGNEAESKTAETKKPRKRKQPVDSQCTSDAKQAIAKKTVKKQSVKNNKVRGSV